jgi:hypothetical protein
MLLGRVAATLAGAAALALASGSPAAAATLVVNGSGQLTGAAGVLVNGASYDVAFVDGTCIALFNGCDSTSDFDFQNEADATAAADALLAQVLTGAFDTDYTLTSGCSANDDYVCSMFIPFREPWSTGDAPAMMVRNTNLPFEFAGLGPWDSIFGLSIQADEDTASGPLAPQSVFARFTPSAASAAPEPSMWVMALTGFAMAGRWLRHSRRRRLDDRAILARG